MMFFIAITAFFIVLFGMPTLIKVAREKGLMDLPEDPRKIHKRAVPTIGGVMIFAALLINVFFWLAVGPLRNRSVPSRFSISGLHCHHLFHGIKRRHHRIGPSKKLLGILGWA